MNFSLPVGDAVGSAPFCPVLCVSYRVALRDQHHSNKKTTTLNLNLESSLQIIHKMINLVNNDSSNENYILVSIKRENAH